MNVHNKKSPCIELKNVTFRYGDHVVLENVSFAVYSGEYIGIIGPNGGGKTTLLKVILSLLKPTSGSVFLQSDEKIGYVSQRLTQSALTFPATVQEVVESGKLSEENPEVLERAFEVSDVAQYKDRLISDLSGGERQRVFIARALANNPTILILDEPVAGVDIAAQEKFYHFLARLNRDFGLTILFVSHDVDVVAREATRVLCLNRTVQCYDSPPDILKAENFEKLYGGKMNVLHHHHKH